MANSEKETPIYGSDPNTPNPEAGEAESAASSEPAKQRNLVSWTLIIAAILSTIFLFALDNTITADVIPAIVQTFGHADKLPWLSVAFQIGGVGVVLPLGRIYALFDAKWLYIFFVVLFCGGSALCGGAPNMDAFIVGRVIAGVGGIGIYLGVMTLLSVNTTTTERPMYLGLVGLVFGVGNVVGPVIGGAFADSSATWRWGFYINLCIIGLMAPVYIFLIPGFQPAPGRTVINRLREIDFVGTLLSIGTLVCLVMAINFGGVLYAWSSGQIIALFVIAGVLFVAFSAQQGLALLTTKERRLFPVVFLHNKEAVLLFILTATFNSAAFIPIYYIPTYFQFTRGDGPLDAGVRLLPLIILITLMIIVNSTVLSKGGYYMPWYLGGSILSLIGCVLLSTADMGTTAGSIYGYEVLTSFAVIQTITSREHMSHGLGFIMIAQLLGVTLALSISGAVFVNQAMDGLSKVLVDSTREQLQSALRGLSGDLGALGEEQRNAALNVVVKCLAKVFIPAYAAAALGTIAALFLRRQKMPSGAVAA
ncbi:MFS general substrate transporter [Cucurbitaria berberidis CBS 394.84]|uniref:MFS general substrate transporter n=1 Tax=Cucurbitaria berberidis CBS 394.84 TaxID=1168544 RepID=A0A9P4GF91_9PLEO|nr:MFS general substrate transporter [Cucurbitaria berberidis CBS 394.84]KAF1844287.1 MFS general substrate transporter [Cucurbitaria berberidis CBS 394.84]